MGSPQNCYSIHTNQHLIISFLVLLLSSSSLLRFPVQGRPNTKLVEVEKIETAAMTTSRVIGSRPPRCDNRCSSCGHCEAIQVPVSTRRESILSRGDDVSNYKPMCWKCKCGNLIFNPSAGN